MSIDLQPLVDKARANGVQKFVVGAGIILDAKLLIVFRVDDEDFLPGYAELPGGGLEKDETLIEALHREVKEETNLDIKTITACTGSFDYISGSGAKTRQFNFIVIPTTNDVILNPKEHSKFEWHYISDIRSISQLPMSKEILKSIEEMASFMKKPIN